jgi:AcrR family transcriptional regulator
MEKALAEQKIKSPELIRTRQAQICRAAVELFSEKGYHGTSIRDIAKKSRISIGSLYDYIRNKEDILYLLAQDFYTQLRREVIKVLEGERDVIKRLEGTLETMLQVVDRFQEYTLFTYRESKYLKKEDLIAVLEQEAFFTETFTKIIQEGIEQGLFETEEPEIVANMLTTLTHSWALKRYSLKRYSFYSFRKVFLDFVLKGLLRKTESLG